jgi:hypothetical protein
MVSSRRGRVFKDGVPKVWIGFAIAAAALGGALACNAILGLGDYAVGDGGTTSGDGQTSDCNVSTDGGQCYPCTPTTNDQLQNACTTSTCVPFDDTTRIPNFDPNYASTLTIVSNPPDGG